eukprot:XP_791217.1 PREDICTED: beta-2 adrenergic receptor-like [Strongylocentrotus purpuratus]
MDSEFSSPFPVMNTTLSFVPGLSKHIKATFFSVMIILTIVFNSFALVVLYRWRRDFDGISRLMFRSLATADLAGGVLIFVSEGMVMGLGHGYAFEEACHFIPFVCSFVVFSSIYHVVLMNIQRYLAICYPFRYARLATAKRLVFLLLAMKCAFLGISFQYLPVQGFLFNSFMRAWCHNNSVPINPDDYTTIDVGTYATIHLAISGTLFIIPFVLLTFINSRLLLIARRASRRSHVQRYQESSSTQTCTLGLKGLRTILIITSLYYVSVIPLFVAVCAVIWHPPLGRQGYDALFFVASAVLLSSCWWNVPVYMSTSATVHKRALELWQKLACFKRVR